MTSLTYHIQIDLLVFDCVLWYWQQYGVLIWFYLFRNIVYIRFWIPLTLTLCEIVLRLDLVTSLRTLVQSWSGIVFVASTASNWWTILSVFRCVIREDARFVHKSAIIVDIKVWQIGILLRLLIAATCLFVWFCHWIVFFDFLLKADSEELVLLHEVCWIMPRHLFLSKAGCMTFLIFASRIISIYLLFRRTELHVSLFTCQSFRRYLLDLGQLVLWSLH